MALLSQPFDDENNMNDDHGLRAKNKSRRKANYQHALQKYAVKANEWKSDLMDLAGESKCESRLTAYRHFLD
jgi:hypothetical protein